MKKLSVLFAILSVFFIAPVISAPTYVGAEKCKICHKTEFESWAQLKHAKAMEALKPEEQKDPKCLACHSTGHGKTEAVLGGVQCEACHGPGSDYKSPAVMKDPAKAKAAGLIIPDKAACEGCHNAKSPTFKGFNYEEMKPKAMHAVKQK
ncbi:MAG: cytochrome c family protein [Acidobacteriota bacterium]